MALQSPKILLPLLSKKIQHPYQIIGALETGNARNAVITSSLAVRIAEDVMHRRVAFKEEDEEEEEEEEEELNQNHLFLTIGDQVIGNVAIVEIINLPAECIADVATHPRTTGVSEKLWTMLNQANNASYIVVTCPKILLRKT